MVARPRLQTRRAIRNSNGALQTIRRSLSAKRLVRIMKSFSIVSSDVALPRRMNQRSYATKLAVLAVTGALKMVVKRIETAEA